MTRLTTSLLSLAAAFVVPAALGAQTTPPKVFHACYVPSSGTVYRIKELDIKQECSKSTHVQFSWTDGGVRVFSASSAQAVIKPGDVTHVDAACPIGWSAVGGGFTMLEFSSGAPIPVVYSSGATSLTTWRVSAWNLFPDAQTAKIAAFVRCAR